MNTDSLAARQREIDNVLVRLPASVHEMAASAASADNMSKNSFFATAVLEVSLAHAVLALDYPFNLEHLMKALDLAHTEDFPAMGAFKRDDWADLRLIIAALADVGLLTDIRVKADAKDPDLVVFALTLTKLGHKIWPRISARIREELANARPKALALGFVEQAVRASSSGQDVPL